MTDSPQSAPLRFVMVGGFLGAGKTTTVGRLAQMYQAQGLKVGIVTNDQATDLVDTQNLRGQGYEVGEVAGACFCCNFNELTDTVAKLAEGTRPDVILAEPVGSCTDLVATVVQPLVQLYGDRFDVAPYAVILKPSHGRRILAEGGTKGFSAKAAYIFVKQLEEADLILINHADALTAEELDELERLVREHQPDVPVLRVSAKTGQGFDGLVDFLDQRGDFGRRVLDIDYDIYAEGEAELGWLNSSLRLNADDEFALDEVLLDVVRGLQDELAAVDAETAHLKVIGLHEGFYGVANLTSSDDEPTLSLPSHCTTGEANVVVNARVAVDPESLQGHVEAVVAAVAAKHGATPSIGQTQSFRPGRPVPTHRLAVLS